MLTWLRFLWTATRGYRLCPWRSPYLLWRVETYTGKKAETVRLLDLLQMLWKERVQLLHFAHWLHSMRTLSEPKP